MRQLAVDLLSEVDLADYRQTMWSGNKTVYVSIQLLSVEAIIVSRCSAVFVHKLGENLNGRQS